MYNGLPRKEIQEKTNDGDSETEDDTDPHPADIGGQKETKRDSYGAVKSKTNSDKSRHFSYHHQIRINLTVYYPKSNTI